MQYKSRYLMLALSMAATLIFFACGGHSGGHHKVEPAHVEHIEGSELSRVTFTEKAMERTGVEMATVSESGGKRVVPYSSLIYDPHGHTWVYTSPEPRTFVRHQVVVDRIEGDEVWLVDGPAAGTVVASVGVAEIYGTEFEVGH